MIEDEENDEEASTFERRGRTEEEIGEVD